MSKFQLKDKVPAFTLPSVSGEDYSFDPSLNEQKNWHLIIYFRGSWCPVCQSELEDLKESKSYFDDKNIQLITVSTDKLDNLKEMAEEHKLSFPILADEDKQVLEAYDVFYHGEDAPYEDHGVHGEPAYFLVDEEGRLLYQQRQTSPFGRPHVNELRKITKYIRKNLKSN